MKHLLIGLLMLTNGVLWAAPEEKPLNPNLEVFVPVLGKVFKGEMGNSTPEQPVHDVVMYERALNGTAVRSFHSINDGAYGGETLVRWDDEAGKLVFHYFTTEGFMTTGHMEVKGDELHSWEKVVDPAKAGGVTEVRAVSTISAERITVKSEYRKDGEWIPGHTATYTPAPDAKVNFR